MKKPVLDRRSLLPALIDKPEDYLFIAGLAGAARDTTALTGEGDNLFALGGAMGGAVSMGLGVALVTATRPVMVVTGDGEMLMNIGALATVASMMPENLTIICIDNGIHGETGGQAGHTSRRTDLARMAEGAGLPSVMTLEDKSGIPAAARFLRTAAPPRFLLARVMPGPPSAVTRNWNPDERRLTFRKAVISAVSDC